MDRGARRGAIAYTLAMQRGAGTRRPPWLAALAALLFLVDVPAHAQPPGLELRWPTVAGCPTQADVEAVVARLVAGGTPRPVSAVATLHRDVAPRWTLRLTLRDADGEQTRVLTSPRCQALADAAAVILAVAAEPLAVATHVAVVAAEPPAITTPVVPAPPAPELAARLDDALAVRPRGAAEAPPGAPADTITPQIDERPPEPLDTPSGAPADTIAPQIDERPPEPLDTRPGLVPAPARARPRVGLDLQGAAALGPSGRAVPGLLLGLSLRWSPLRLQARASHWFASRVHHPDRADLGVTLRLTAVTLRACPVLARGPVDLELCGGLELGALRAEGDGLQQNFVRRGLWAAGVLGAGARYRPLRWLALGLELEAALAFSRHRYGAEDLAGDFHTTPVLGVRGIGGLTFIFP